MMVMGIIIHTYKDDDDGNDEYVDDV